jgi:4-hydroxybenzoate polyprenyltransferase
MLTVHVALRLGRVSNLPTVWSNALAGATLAGLSFDSRLLLIALALSAFYISGMWLNDAFDAEVDRKLAPDRPIPSGEVSRNLVFAGGFLFMGVGLALSALMGWQTFLSGVVLAGTILLYDAVHKKTALAPVIMGATRGLCYVLAASSVVPVAAPALGLFAYIVALTYGAKQEAYDRIEQAWPFAVLVVPFAVLLSQGAASGSALVFAIAFLIAVAIALRWMLRRARGDVRRAVVLMIASISLYDAALVASTGAFATAVLCAICMGLTLLLQRVASGT